MNIEVLEGLIKNIELYDAHTNENGRKEVIKRESLTEHVKRSIQYFRRLWEEKRLDEMTDRFCSQMWGGLTEQGRHFLEEMILGIPLFHDVGKINPEFQARKMKNHRIAEDNVFFMVGGKHSIISSVLYIDYFLQMLRKEVKDKEEKKRLRPLILFFAHVIERHHSDLGSFNEFLNTLVDGRGRAVIEIFEQGKCSAYQKKFSLSCAGIKNLTDEIRGYTDGFSKDKCIAVYTYVKMMYSLLVASDYYATSEFKSEIQIRGFGNLDEMKDWIKIYENTKLMQSIREYQRECYPMDADLLKADRNINHLRTEMLSDAEAALDSSVKEIIFYLEAPTGSGKSNTAMDLGFLMMRADERLRKIYYTYPFNTLVEQNLENLRKIFGGESKIFESIAVVNALTPIKMTESAKKEEEESEQTMYYQKALLDRQFLNYPMILTTHVSLFDTMFGDTKESSFGFHQLMNSVIVLDEIQSYKNTIWGEIICFLKEFAYLMNIKIIIMSATLPNLDLLSEHTYKAVQLLRDRGKYFSNPCFKERVKLSYELMKEEDTEAALLTHIKESAKKRQKILVEFIKRDSAYGFFRKLAEDEEITCDVEYMSGDDSLMERSRILNRIKEEGKPVILVATQVIEAGIDIDMDIGYKNISKLDSEEQFLGRINRSCLRNGQVYFFKLDHAKRVYGIDVRIEKEFTLENEKMREILENKDFSIYYEQILGVLKRNYNDQVGPGGLEMFFSEEVGKLHWPHVMKRMQLIPEDKWSMSVYLARVLEDEDGTVIDGRRIWEQYVELLGDFEMDYAEKKVRLSEITSKMNYFIYQIKRNDDLVYNDKVGEIFFISEGEKYFADGKLDRKRVQGEIGEFVDFI